MISNFNPGGWVDVVRARLEQSADWWARLHGPVRHGHHLPPTPEQVTEFEAWRARYEAARDEGYDRGWLYGGYEPDEVIDAPEGEWVFDESEADFQARVAAWEASTPKGGVVQIPIVNDREKP